MVQTQICRWLQKCFAVVAVAVFFGASGDRSAVQAQTPPVPGDRAVVEDLRLPDVYGQERQVSELLGPKCTVVAFVGTECPMARLYGPRLRDLAVRF